ncbi:hypothetical protein NKG99_35450 [Mesorhizobium sp. M1409]|uniref:hypothetical protein n=1 Tax=unclassified Mesorhizobium TaxID=325217 RepID=UPI003336D75A
MSASPRLSQQPRGSTLSKVSCGGGLQIHAPFSSAAESSTANGLSAMCFFRRHQRLASHPTSPPNPVQTSAFVNWWLASKAEPGSLVIGGIFGGRLCLEPKNCQFAVLNNMNDPSATGAFDAHVIRFASL